MASVSNLSCAIDIGNSSMKALLLSNETGAVEVVSFDNIQHGKILSGDGIKDTERNELIALSLRQLTRQFDLSRNMIVVSVPSQNSFARFVTLPPVEKKRIPEIVKFEAAQQIPFDINDVQWDWQLMTEPDKPDMQVGIFAIKNETVRNDLDHFSREDIRVSCVQMAPMALYNYVHYEYADLLAKSHNHAIVVLNIGAESTDLVICTRSTVWQRCIPMGGNTFTRAIASAFKLDFEKAEKLKRTAAMSKYARQIFQSMRPVFADLAAEIQRSIGFYVNSNASIKIVKVVGMGGGTRMRGLLKYLQQTLAMPVERPDMFKKLTVRSADSVAKFHENVCDFGVVYGLALQGLGLAKIESNLLPRSIARSMVWATKTRYFTAAAAMLLLVSLLALARAFLDRASYSSNAPLRQDIKNVINTANQASSEMQNQLNKAPASQETIKRLLQPFMYRSAIPLLYQSIMSAVPNENNNPAQAALYRAFANNDIETILSIPRKDRKQIFITSISASYAEDVAAAEFAAATFVTTVGRGGTRRGLPIKEKFGGSVSDDLQMEAMGITVPGGGAVYRPRAATRRERTPQAEGEAEKAGPGFVVTITGFSPYKDIAQLLDPYGVENEPNKWGFVTRLMNLNKNPDPNFNLELYKKEDIQHFTIQTGLVELNTDMPEGIGIDEMRTFAVDKANNQPITEPVKSDPMTKEIISKEPIIDKNGNYLIDNTTGNTVLKNNDNWFVIQVKFLWKKANAPAATAATAS